MGLYNKDTKEVFIHRDISWLMFNEKVIEEASDNLNPIIERMKFLAIFFNNFDEFFMVRVAGLKRLIDSGYNKKDQFGYYPQEIWQEIKAKSSFMIRKAYDVYENELQKEAAHRGIFIRKYKDLGIEEKKYAKRYFEYTLFPIITPMAVDQTHPFPVLSSKSIAFAVNLIKKKDTYITVIPIPKSVPRLLKLPSKKGIYSFITIDEIMKANIDYFLRGYKIVDCPAFRVLRDSELVVNEEYKEDFLEAIESEVRKRPRAKAVYIEANGDMSPIILDTLCKEMFYEKEEVVPINGDMDMSYLFELAKHVQEPDLYYKSYVPVEMDYQNIFDRIKEEDFLVHMPYRSFKPAVDLVRQAADDANVLAIKMTLYRTNEDSAIILALKNAALKKKQVTVLVELKARFEEEKNINWAKELEYAGCHVIYGMPDLKIHSKITIIIRKEESGIAKYVHVSTGNYNENTAKIYTDIGYFTDNDDLARDISDLFNVITGYSIPSKWDRIICAPYNFRENLERLINKEMEFQKRYNNGAIFIKINSLEDTGIIKKLYEASKAGVKIRLIVRGICCLIPGIEGLSDNIEVHSIVGRFPEHSRIYIFNNNSDPKVFISSADLMTRNIDKRIEIFLEIMKEKHKSYLRSVMESYLKDEAKSRILTKEKSYIRSRPADFIFNAQEYFIENEKI